jgi:hypothetical protein
MKTLSQLPPTVSELTELFNQYVERVHCSLIMNLPSGMKLQIYSNSFDNHSYKNYMKSNLPEEVIQKLIRIADERQEATSGFISLSQYSLNAYWLDLTLAGMNVTDAFSTISICKETNSVVKYVEISSLKCFLLCIGRLS